MSQCIVSKHGGVNMANPANIARVVKMTLANPDRRIIVVSAPGKDGSYGKITDLLIICYERAKTGQDFLPQLSEVIDRFVAIAEFFKVEPPHRDFNRLGAKLWRLKSGSRRVSYDWVVSRGEYMMAKIMAEILHAKFVDARGLIRIDCRGNVTEETYQLIHDAVADNSTRFVFPGFYGTDSSNVIKLFSRGGSDITGAVVAKAVGASCYENVKENSGVAVADPGIVGQTVKYFSQLSYAFMYEMASRGAQVLHPSAVYPAESANIPIHFLSLFAPDEIGTTIVNNGDSTAVGLAGHQDCLAFRVAKAGMDSEVGFGEKALEVFNRQKIPFQYMPAGEQDILIVVTRKDLGKNSAESLRQVLIAKLDAIVDVIPMATLSIVSETMITDAGFASKIFDQLSQIKVQIRMLSGIGSRSLVIGIDPDLYVPAIQALYEIC